MKRVAILALCLIAGMAVTAEAANAPTFGRAAVEARKALPTYVHFSCTRGSGPVVTCEMLREAKGWRYVRSVAVRRSGKPRVGRETKLCRTAPAKANRCGFPMPGARNSQRRTA